MNPTEDRNAALDALSFKLASPEPQQEEVETPIEPEVQAEADTKLAEGGPSMFQQVQGLAIEGGGNIGGMYLANKYRAPAKIAKGLTFLNKIRTVGRGAALAGTAGPQAFEPVSTIGGVAAFAATEAAVGIFSNVVKQEYFKALGVQEETSGGEILASGLLISQVIKQGNKLPILGQAFDTAMLKSRKWKVGAHMVQGAVVGSVESSIRQTFDLMMNEDASISDFSMKDLMTGVAAGATMGGTLSLGSDGIKLIKTYRAVVARSKVEMRGSLVEKLAKLDASITKMQKMKQGGRRKVVTEMRYAETKKELDQLDAVHDSIDEKLSETEAALESVNTPKEAPTVTEEQVNLANDWDARKAAEGEEVTPTNLEGVDVVEAPETPATPKETPEATPARKNLESDFKPKKVKAAGDTHPVFKVKVNGEDVYIGSSDTMGLGRIYHVTDENGFDHLTLSGNKLEGEGNLGAANEYRDGFYTRKELIEALKEKAEVPEALEASSTPEATPAPKTPFQALMDDYDTAIAEQSQGRGADQIVTLNKHFNAISDDFAKKADALIANPNAESVDDLLSMLDEYTAFDAKDAELKQKTGQGSRAQGRDAGDADFEREKMSPERQIRNNALKDVREKLQAMKDDVDGAAMQKLVDDIFTYPETVKGKSTRLKFPNPPSPDEAFTPPPKDGEAPVETPKGETKAPKKSSRERSIARLQKKLDELRAIRSGEKDPKNPKPKKAKSAEEKDLEERIKFYQGESKEVADIASTQERIQVLSGLIQGNNPSQIRQQIGLPPKLLPAHAKPKKIETTLTKLKATEAKLMKILRRKQTDAILSDMRNIFDPSHESRSIVDKALNGYLMARTDALLNQPSTATTGLLSGAIQTVWRPLINTGRNTIQAINPADRALKGVPMTGRMKYAAADALATADQLLTFAQSPIVTSKQALRNTYETFKQGGSSAYFYKDANKIDVRDDAINAGNSTILNSRSVIQGDIRAKANAQKSVIVSKSMKLMGSDPMTALMGFAKMSWSAGRRGVGALDEPFNLILEGRGHRADAIKEAIKQKIKPEEVAGFIDDYVKKASTVDAQGIRRFNYLDDKYRNSADQTRRGLFRPADLEKGDPRVLMEEHLVNFFRSASGGDLTAGKLLFRFLSPIITTPTVGLAQQGRTLARATGVPAVVDIGQRIYAGGAKRVGKKGKISNVMSGGVNKQINDLEMTVEDLRAKTKEKGLDPEEQKKRDENLAANKEKLKSLRDYRDEQTYEKIAMMGLGMGLFYTFFELGKQGIVTGAGAQFTRDQRNNGEFQKYKMGAGEDSEGWTYLLGEPIRFLAAFAADLGAWSELGNSRTKDQTIGNFITSTLEAYATDSVFTTSLRHMKDLAFGKEKTRTGAVIDIAAGALPIPSAVRSARTLDDENYSVYDEGAGAGDILSRAFDKAVGTESENVRLDKLGRPLLRPERGALSYVFRYAPEDRAYRMTAEEEVRQVLRADGLSYNLIPKLTDEKTINGTEINLKEFTRKDRSLFQLFGDVMNDGDDMLHELHDLVTDDDWPTDYDNYTVEPNPDNKSQQKMYNRGIERFNDIRKKHIKRAVDYISDEANINLYRNKDGQTVHEYIESLKERPAKSGNVLETFPNY